MPEQTLYDGISDSVVSLVRLSVGTPTGLPTQWGLPLEQQNESAAFFSSFSTTQLRCKLPMYNYIFCTMSEKCKCSTGSIF